MTALTKPRHWWTGNKALELAGQVVTHAPKIFLICHPFQILGGPCNPGEGLCPGDPDQPHPTVPGQQRRSRASRDDDRPAAVVRGRRQGASVARIDLVVGVAFVDIVAVDRRLLGVGRRLRPAAVVLRGRRVADRRQRHHDGGGCHRRAVAVGRIRHQASA